ncbi:MAG: IPT/TIG domain-containing protein, partial [Bacillota bacterium]
LEWNGVPLQGMAVTNNFIGQFVQATIPAADLATAGSATVALVTPGPGGGTSQTTFTVTVHPPEIDSLNPGFIAPGSGDFTLSLYGQDFDPSAAVYWNSDQLAITQISSGQIQVTVPAAEVMTAGVAKLTVVNPDAAGGTSVPASFAVDASGTSIQALAQPVNDIEWDPRQFTLYGTTHSADANYPHDIVSIDPVAVGIVASTGTSPTVEGRQLSLSKDGTMLYVGLIAPWGVERVAMPGFTYAGNLPIFSGGSQAVVASGVQASPLYSHVAAVTILSNGLASSNQGATVFDDTDAVRYFSQNETWDAMAWSADGLSLYGGDTLDSPKSFMSGAYSLTATGTIPIQSTGGLWAGGPMHVDLGSGLVYADGSANVIDPVGGAVAASYPVSGVMVPDSSLGCAYFIYQTEAQAGTSDWTLACYSTTDQTLTRSIAIPSLNGAPTKMMRWGNEGLAFITDGGYIYFVSGQVVTGN